MFRTKLVIFLLLHLPSAVAAQVEIAKHLQREIIAARQTLEETERFCATRVPRLPKVTSAEQWQQIADRLRQRVLDEVVFRGKAAEWRTAKTKVEWLEEIPAGPGYRIKKVRYEALPGLWIPALLYEPQKLEGKVPVYLAVNGHDRNGKAAPYKQIRCINLAKRGVITLNVEWLGMGQLNTDNYLHYRMNQLDLCGTSGLAPFYLAMKRGLDLLLQHKHADPERVAVSGLSGGGWQTIFISSLDTRVTLCNPVAGYSSYLTRIRHHKDLGDSEQTPCDLATIVDYTHLTAMMAPRATLLTYNIKDNCCFESGYALPPLVAAARPVFRLFSKEKNLRTHVNVDPGTHNYELDNRQQFYRLIGDHFFPGQKDYSFEEIPSAGELKTAQRLTVALPKKNADFHTLALALAQSLPRTLPLPKTEDERAAWQKTQRRRLVELVKLKAYPIHAEMVGEKEIAGGKIQFWKLQLGKDWTVPAVEFSAGKATETVMMIADLGRKSLADEVKKSWTAGRRVLVVDPFYFGECRIASRDFLFALLVSCVGERPLGIQAGQVNAIANWARKKNKHHKVTLSAYGPRTSLIALVAAAADANAIAAVELHGALGSLKEVIQQNRSVREMPEMFCFGLLASFDVAQLTALCQPRPVTVVKE